MSNGFVDTFERNGTIANMHDTDLRNTIGQANGLAQLDSNGKLPSNVVPSDTTKADKVTNPTNGNLAKLDSNGNLADSGVASSTLEAIVEVSGVSIMVSVDDHSTTFLLRKPEGMTRYCCRLLVCNQGDTSGAGFTGDYFIGVNAYGETIYEITGRLTSATITRRTDEPDYVVVEFNATTIWASAMLTGPKDYIV